MGTMPASRTSKKRTSSEDSARDTPRNPGNASEEEDTWGALRSLAAGTMVSIRRTYPPGPQFCGWLDDVEVPDGGVEDLPVVIREKWGGGRFVIQRKSRNANNQVRFGEVVTITIAGEPIVAGRMGSTRNEAVQQSPQPYVVQAPDPNPAYAQLQGKLLSMFESLGGNRPQTNPSDMLSALTEAMRQGTSVAPQQPSALSQMTEMMGMFRQAQKIFGDRPEPPEVSESPLGDILSGEGGIEKMLMMKLLGGGLDGMFGGQQRQPQMPPPPSPYHVFHPQRGWMHPSQMQAPPPQPPPPQPPPPQPPPPQPPPPQSPTTAAPTEPAAADDAPLTAQEVMSELDAMEPEELAKLVPLVEKLPAIKQLLEKMESSSKDELDLSGTYPAAS